jgi:hypothetical protein
VSKIYDEIAILATETISSIGMTARASGDLE